MIKILENEDAASLNKKFGRSLGLSTGQRITPSSFHKKISGLKVGTCIKYAKDGARVGVNRSTFCLVKIADNTWTPYSSILGFVDGATNKITDDDLLNRISNRNAKSIYVIDGQSE